MKATFITMPTTPAGPPRTLLYFLGYGAVYFSFLFAMHRFSGFDLGEPLLVLGLMGIGFSALAWWATRRSIPLPFPSFACFISRQSAGCRRLRARGSWAAACWWAATRNRNGVLRFLPPYRS